MEDVEELTEDKSFHARCLSGRWCSWLHPGGSGHTHAEHRSLPTGPASWSSDWRSTPETGKTSWSSEWRSTPETGKTSYHLRSTSDTHIHEILLQGNCDLQECVNVHIWNCHWIHQANMYSLTGLNTCMPLQWHFRCKMQSYLHLPLSCFAQYYTADILIGANHICPT